MPKQATRTFTKKTVDALSSDNPGGTWYADRDLKGFYVRVYPNDEKVFMVRYRDARGARKVTPVGRYGALTVQQAREKAEELLSKATLGGDPAGDRQKAREMPTFASWKKSY